MSTAKPGMRFLPTLTEVVQMPSAEVPPKNHVTVHASDVVQRAMDLLEARMGEQIQVLLQDQVHNALDSIRDEMKRAVSDAVEQALRESQ